MYHWVKKVTWYIRAGFISRVALECNTYFHMIRGSFLGEKYVRNVSNSRALDQ